MEIYKYRSPGVSYVINPCYRGQKQNYLAPQNGFQCLSALRTLKMMLPFVGGAVSWLIVTRIHSFFLACLKRPCVTERQMDEHTLEIIFVNNFSSKILILLS